MADGETETFIISVPRWGTVNQRTKHFRSQGEARTSGNGVNHCLATLIDLWLINVTFTIHVLNGGVVS